MKKMTTLSVLLFAVAMLVSCDKKNSAEAEEENDTQYQVEYIGFQAEEDGPWGLMATDGTVLVKPKFDGYISAVINDRFFVDEDGSTLYTAEANPRKIGTYKECGSFTSDLCPVQDMDDNILYIDKDGKTVLDVTEINGKRVLGAYNFFCGRALINADRKWGYIDEEGEPVIPIKYADAWHFSEDLAIIYLDNPTYEADDMGKWCVIDTEGNKLFTKRFSEYRPSEFKYANGLLEVVDPDENYYLLDKNGKVVMELKDKLTNFIGEDLISITNTETHKSGIMDRDGEYVIRPKFMNMMFNGKLLVASTDDDDYALYSLDGEKIADLPEGYVTLFDKEFKDCDSYLIVGDWENGYKLIDAEGNKVNTKYDIHSYSVNYNWGFTTMEYEEYYDEDEMEEYEEQ